MERRARRPRPSAAARLHVGTGRSSPYRREALPSGASALPSGDRRLDRPHSAAHSLEVGRVGDLLMPEELRPRPLGGVGEVVRRTPPGLMPAPGRLIGGLPKERAPWIGVTENDHIAGGCRQVRRRARARVAARRRPASIRGRASLRAASRRAGSAAARTTGGCRSRCRHRRARRRAARRSAAAPRHRPGVLRSPLAYLRTLDGDTPTSSPSSSASRIPASASHSVSGTGLSSRSRTIASSARRRRVASLNAGANTAAIASRPMPRSDNTRARSRTRFRSSRSGCFMRGSNPIGSSRTSSFVIASSTSGVAIGSETDSNRSACMFQIISDARQPATASPRRS